MFFHSFFKPTDFHRTSIILSLETSWYSSLVRDHSYTYPSNKANDAFKMRYPLSLRYLAPKYRNSLRARVWHNFTPFSPRMGRKTQNELAHDTSATYRNFFLPRAARRKKETRESSRKGNLYTRLPCAARRCARKKSLDFGIKARRKSTRVFAATTAFLRAKARSYTCTYIIYKAGAGCLTRFPGARLMMLRSLYFPPRPGCGFTENPNTREDVRAYCDVACM